METTSFGNYVEIKDQKIELEGTALIHLNEIRKWTHFLSILGFPAGITGSELTSRAVTDGGSDMYPDWK